MFGICVYKVIAFQSQYVFIHDALDEFLKCGDTEVAATNVRIAIGRLGRQGPSGLTGFEQQFLVS